MKVKMMEAKIAYIKNEYDTKITFYEWVENNIKPITNNGHKVYKEPLCANIYH